MPEICKIPNFVKIVRAVLEIVNIYIPTYIYIYTILARLIISGDNNKMYVRVSSVTHDHKRKQNSYLENRHFMHYLVHLSALSFKFFVIKRI